MQGLEQSGIKYGKETWGGGRLKRLDWVNPKVKFELLIDWGININKNIIFILKSFRAKQSRDYL